MGRRAGRVIAVLACVGLLVAPGVDAAASVAPVSLAPVPRAVCGPGSRPETGLQGRVSAADVASGRAALGYTCNAEQVGHYGTSGGYRVQRYVDGAGHECAYYDTALLFPKDTSGSNDLTGVYALDMADPAHPVRTATLLTPAMQSPHESLNIDPRRGLLVADQGNPTTYPGWVDVYDVSRDCRHPVLASSLPVGVLGHEGTFSPDGKTFWVASPAGNLTAVDVSRPTSPARVWSSFDMHPHGLNVSDDGNTLFYADLGNSPGLTILDVSQVQRRSPKPMVRVLSHLTWDDTMSTPQVPIPVRIGGHPYLIEVDEFASTASGAHGTPSNPNGRVGAARVIDIADLAHPRVISNIRLEVHNRENRRAIADDPGNDSPMQGYAAHYCAVPKRDDPGIVACSFILSGLRVFDIRDPYHPKEAAYFNAPVHPTASKLPGSSYAMSAPTFAPARHEIWYSDANDGFYALRLTNGAWPSS